MTDAKENSQKCWLIKSGGKILGPFEFRELILKIEGHEVSPIDEACFALGRWRLVRDTHELTAELKSRGFNSLGPVEDTSTATHSQTYTNSQTDEITQDLESMPALKEGMARESVTRRHPPRSDSQPVKTYGYQGDRNVQELVKPKAPMLLWVVVFLLAATIGYIVYNEKFKENVAAQKFVPIEDLLDQAIRFKSFGQFKQSLQVLKTAQQSNPHNSDVQLMMAPLLLKTEGQTVLARRMLNDLMASRYEDDAVTQIHASLGYAALLDEDFKEAEFQFQRSLEKTPDNSVVRFDMAAALFYQKKFDEALQSLSMINEKDLSASALLTGIIYLNLGDLSQGENKKTFYQKSLQALEAFKGKNFDFLLDAYFVRAMTQLKLGQKNDVDESIRALIAVVPQLTELHYQDPLLFQKPFSWRQYRSQCRLLAEGVRLEVDRQAFLGFCYARMGEKSEALKNFEKLLQSSSTGKGWGQYLSYLIENGEAQKAALLLKRADLAIVKAAENEDFSQQDPLGLYLLIEEKIKERNYDFAQRWIPRLEKRWEYSVQVIDLKLRMSLQRNEPSKVQSLLGRGLGLDPQFIPFLKLEKGEL